jgi:spermidine synthase
VGGVYLVNTLGAIAGSVLTGFVLIPLLGSRGTLLAGAIANLALVAAGMLAFGGPLARRGAGIAACVIVGVVCLLQPPWPALVYDAGLGGRLDGVAARAPIDLERRLRRAPTRLLSLEEGVNATISVRQFSGQLTLLVNGKPDASSSGDMSTQAMLGSVPLLVHPRPRSVNVIGFGSGVTAYVATLFPEAEKIDVVEIEPAVVRASRFFHPLNNAVERNPRVRVIFDDARSQLQTADRGYDVIVSEPSNPWMAGVASLFSRDFYQLAKRRLNAGGIFGQWLQLYRLDSASVAMILRTMLASFPHVQVWHSDPYNAILLGSDGPILVSLDRVERAYRAERRLRVIAAAYGPGPQSEHFFGGFILERAGLERVAARFPRDMMTDDRPLLEYRALRFLYEPAHSHIEALWQAKLDLGDLMPPLRDRRPPPGLALAGAAAIAKRMASLGDLITSWGGRRYADEPQLRLARAKLLERRGRSREARELLRTLPTDPGYRAEAALLEARILIHERRFEEAAMRLLEMGRFRPTARLWYQLEAAQGARRGGDAAWDYAEALQRALDDPWDIDAIAIQREDLYQRLSELIQATQKWQRGIAVLRHRVEPMGGELHRLVALVVAYRGAKMHKEAARVMDEIRSFELADLATLDLCAKTYSDAGETARAEGCEAERRRFTRPLKGIPLWGSPPTAEAVPPT